LSGETICCDEKTKRPWTLIAGMCAKREAGLLKRRGGKIARSYLKKGGWGTAWGRRQMKPV